MNGSFRLTFLALNKTRKLIERIPSYTGQVQHGHFDDFDPTLNLVPTLTLPLPHTSASPKPLTVNRQSSTVKHTNQQPTTMPDLLTIPNELLDEIASYLDPPATSHLLLTCRLLAFLLKPAMHLHAEAPKENEPALHWAAGRGHIPLMQHLLTRFPVDLEKPDGSTPLHAATSSGRNTLAVEFLLQHGADVNHANCHGLTPFHYAFPVEVVDEDLAESLVRLFIAHGANIHGESHSPLGIAVAYRYVRVARLLLEAGASPDTRSSNGEPVLVTATRPGGARILELLLDHGADTDAANPHGSTALLIASQYGPLETVRMLVARGVNLDCHDHDGDTPLLVAIMGGQRLVAEYLARLQGVDVHSANVVGQEPWSRALAMDYDEVLRALLNRGVVMEF